MRYFKFLRMYIGAAKRAGRVVIVLGPFTSRSGFVGRIEFYVN